MAKREIIGLIEAWCTRQYHEAVNDPDTLVVRGGKPLKLQLSARWSDGRNLECCDAQKAINH